MADLKEAIEKIKEIPGNVRGDIIISNLLYIRSKKGDIGLNKVKEKVKELNFSQSLDKIRALEWYPESLSVSIILSAKEVFNWTEKDVFEMGNSSTKTSFIMKALMRYFISIDKVFEEASRYWDKYFDFGKLNILEKDKKNKRIVISVEGHNFHPDICIYQAGFMLKIAQLSIGQKEVEIKETKCFFKGDNCHEYLITWQ